MSEASQIVELQKRVDFLEEVICQIADVKDMSWPDHDDWTQQVFDEKEELEKRYEVWREKIKNA